MSRVGKKPIKIEQGITIDIQDGGAYGYKTVTVKGPKGELKEDIRKGVSLEVNNDEVLVNRDNDLKKNRGLHGLYRTLISNMFIGVKEGFIKELEIHGVGYRVALKGNALEFNLGQNHPIVFEAPEGIKFEVADGVDIKVSGINKQLVGEVAAKIRDLKRPEPYKGKGIRYKGEQVRRKAGKTAGA